MSAGKVLVVDDDPQIRRVMKATLVGHGYEVVEARTGEDALERFPREMPSLVLLDMNMPGMDGLETCRSIRSGSDIPVNPVGSYAGQPNSNLFTPWQRLLARPS